VKPSAFIDICLARRSVRKFLDRPVEREKIERCLEAARIAPSADNFQPWRFLVFDDPAKKDALADAVLSGAYAYTRPLAKAPVLVCLIIKESLLVIDTKQPDETGVNLSHGLAFEYRGTGDIILPMSRYGEGYKTSTPVLYDTEVL